MKKINIIILLSTVYAFPIFSQSIYFSKIFARTFPFYGSISSVVTLKDKGYVFLLDMQDYKNDTNTVNIIRVNAKGDTLWNVEHKFEVEDAIYGPNSIIEVENNNFVINGYVAIKDSTYFTGYTFFLKINKYGKAVWYKKFKNKARACYGGGVKITKLTGEGYICTGMGVSYNEQIKKEGDVNAFVVKVDTTGKELWQNTIGGNTFNEILTGVTETADSNFLLVGRKYNGNGFDNIVVKLNKNGQLMWNKNFGIAQYDEAFSTLIRSKDNNFIICGVSGTSEPQSITDESSVLTKIDKDGNKIWDKRYTTETSNMTFQQVEELEDGSIVTVGQQDLKPYKPGITKFDKDGKVLWHRVFDYNPKEGNPERFNSFAKTSDKGFIIGGQAFQDIPSPKGSQGWLLKLDSLGCDYAGCAKSTSTAEVEDGKEVFVIAPNPADLSVMVTLRNDLEEITNLKVELFDLQGQLIQKTLPLENENRSILLNTSELSNGIYFVKIKNTTQKLIVQH